MRVERGEGTGVCGKALFGNYFTHPILVSSNSVFPLVRNRTLNTSNENVFVFFIKGVEHTVGNLR